MMQPAVFIDRDGTLSEEVGYVNHPSRFHLFPFSVAAVKRLNEEGFLAVVLTNQSGVARGYFPEEMVTEIHNNLRQTLVSNGAHLDGIYYCAHHPNVGNSTYRLDCSCRKPKIGLVERACADFKIDLNASWMIGDRYRDVEMAHNAGLHSALVFTGYGRGEWEFQREQWTQQPELVCENLLEAVESIIELQNR